MDSILNWYKEEGFIFKGGSGAGLNLSRIRSSKELLSSGGTASGPVSFMRGADASAGTIKSGGATRRAAKMVVLDVDHPDIVEFVETKAREEDKIRALRDAGFDMDLGGADITSVQYQNANNSVRVSDEFMRAVEDGTEFGLRARKTGEVIETVDARELFRKISKAAWECADPGLQYDDTINDWHTNPETGRITASNPCSEYMSLDNSSCNLASLNLLKFLRDDDTFDAERFAQAVELIITAMDISICFADFPTEAIGDTTVDYRQLGIGYANLGALLMAMGLGYDSDGGRAMAAAITSLMTGTSYRRSAELAAVVGPYAGYARNAEAHQRVMRKHQAANDTVRTLAIDDAQVHKLATTEWAEVVELGKANGFRNAQASVLAPTGCLTADRGDTDRGLTRLGELGDVWGDKWQDLDAQRLHRRGSEAGDQVLRQRRGADPQDRAPRAATRIQGTLATGSRSSTRCPAMGLEADGRRRARRPRADAAQHHGRRTARARAAARCSTRPTTPVTATSPRPRRRYRRAGRARRLLHGRRQPARQGHPPVRGRRRPRRGRAARHPLQGAVPPRAGRVHAKQGYHEVTLQSVRLARWWQAAGFAKTLPQRDHSARAGRPAFRRRSSRPTTRASTPPSCAASSRPTAPCSRGAFLSRPRRSPSPREVARSCSRWASRRPPATPSAGAVGRSHQVRVRNVDHASRFHERDRLHGRPQGAPRVRERLSPQSGNRDRILLPRAVWDELAPLGSALATVSFSARWRKNGWCRAERLEQVYRRDATTRAWHTPSATSSSGSRPTRTAACSRRSTSPCRRTSPTWHPASSATTPSAS